MSSYWEDRLDETQYLNVEVALRVLRATRLTQEDQDACFDELTMAGLSSEEADELINVQIVD